MNHRAASIKKIGFMENLATTHDDTHFGFGIASTTQ